MKGNKKISISLMVFFWFALSYLIFFEFDEISDNFFFLPGLISWVIMPIAIWVEYRAGSKK